MAGTAKLNVQTFPRPPLLEKTGKHIQIRWHGEVIADTKDAYRVLETHHPPTYYLPPQCVHMPLSKTGQTTFCEFKGTATYYSIMSPADADDVVVNRIWSYSHPADGYQPLAGYLAFYAGPWQCYVDGEEVQPQPGDFYGGWVTSEIEGVVKGQWGNWDPVLPGTGRGPAGYYTTV